MRSKRARAQSRAEWIREANAASWMTSPRENGSGGAGSGESTRVGGSVPRTRFSANNEGPSECLERQSIDVYSCPNSRKISISSEAALEKIAPRFTSALAYRDIYVV